MNVIYYGAFDMTGAIEEITSDAGYRTKLEKPVPAPHVTFKFNPEKSEMPWLLIGEKINVKLIAYGCDGENEGFLVEILSDDPEIMKLVKEIEKPHVTLSTSRSGKPFNTRFLDFKELDDPINVEMTIGAFIESDWRGGGENEPTARIIL